MRKSIKVLLVTVVLTVACVTPVFATETNLDAEMQYIENHVKEVGVQITNYLKTDDGCGSAAKLDHANHAFTVDSQLNSWVSAEEANYINYLKGVVVNKKETERIKQQNIVAIQELAKVNPSFADQIAAATAEYNAAVADRIAAEAAIPEAQAKFAMFNLILNQNVEGAREANKAADK